MKWMADNHVHGGKDLQSPKDLYEFLINREVENIRFKWIDESDSNDAATISSKSPWDSSKSPDTFFLSRRDLLQGCQLLLLLPRDVQVLHTN